MNAFKDHFSAASDRYAAFRPDYPAALFEWLAGLCPRSGTSVGHGTAWDCATGSGQAAQGLARLFQNVIATDASAEQIFHATPHPGIVYRVAAADASGLADNSVDLITVAQAAHWFDLPDFYAEATRVMKPDGIIALWAYGLARIDPAIDTVITRFYRDTVGPYWPPERRWIEDGYRTLPFPFEEIIAPAFGMKAEWDLSALLAYLSTWSAVKRCKMAQGDDPIPPLRAELKPLWGDSSNTRQLQWPLFMKVGRLPEA